MGVLRKPPKWQDFCSPLLFWLACSSLPRQSQCHSTLQPFPEDGTTMEMLAGRRTSQSPSMSGPALSRRSLPLAESKELETFHIKKKLALDDTDCSCEEIL